MNTDIKILDCTLRDGGYINNWKFGLDNIKNIISHLNSSKIDFIECGFLTDSERGRDQSLFNNLEQIQELLPQNVELSKLGVMISFGEFDMNNLPEYDGKHIQNIRLIFKKAHSKEALDVCQKIKDKGYRLFINPTVVDNFKKEEMAEIINQVNTIKPFSFSIVDTLGGLDAEHLEKIFDFINPRLNDDISICFHSHNSRQLSLSNAVELIAHNENRKLIIDTSVMGIGRGAGNGCTELLAKYLNEKFEKNYNIQEILKLLNEYINPIYKKTPWGYSLPYHIAAINHCHPNYATYLISKKNMTPDILSELLNAIPQEHKSDYNEDYIEHLYLYHNKYKDK